MRGTKPLAPLPYRFLSWGKEIAFKFFFGKECNSVFLVCVKNYLNPLLYDFPCVDTVWINLIIIIIIIIYCNWVVTRWQCLFHM